MGRRLGILGAFGLVPLSGLGRGIVQRLVLDAHVAGLAATLIYGHLYGVDHGGGLEAVRALTRQVTDYLYRLASAAARTALIPATATTGDQGRYHDQCHKTHHGPM
jgi:hypothetical protein